MKRLAHAIIWTNLGFAVGWLVGHDLADAHAPEEHQYFVYSTNLVTPYRHPIWSSPTMGV